MKALIINVDRDHRSVYTGMIAACLISKIPNLEITAIVSSENKLLETTGHFKELHLFNTEEFFNRTKDMTSTDVESEIRKALDSIIKIKWNVVINLTSNLLGSIFTSFLNSDEVRGTYLNSDLSSLKHSDLPSYYLAKIPEEGKNYFHFTYLYRCILKRFESVTLNSVWRAGVTDEFTKHFNSLKAQNTKSHIVFLDTGIIKSNKVSDIEFFIELFNKLQKEGSFLPILLGRESAQYEQLIKKLQDDAEGEVHSLIYDNEALLSIFSVGSTLITNDLYLKSISDLVLKPSIFISKKLNLDDYSIVQNSYQVVSPDLNTDLANTLFLVCGYALNNTTLKKGDASVVEIFKSKTIDGLPVIAPLNANASLEYASWWLGLRFLSKFQNLNLPPMKLNPTLYQNAIYRERQNLMGKAGEGIYLIASEMARADIKNGPAVNEKQLVQNLNKFFDGEEAGL